MKECKKRVKSLL